MEPKRLNHLEQIPQEDWEKTPTSVKKLVEEMAQQIEREHPSFLPRGRKSVKIIKTSVFTYR